MINPPLLDILFLYLFCVYYYVCCLNRNGGKPKNNNSKNKENKSLSIWLIGLAPFAMFSLPSLMPSTSNIEVIHIFTYLRCWSVHWIIKKERVARFYTFKIENY